MYIYLNMQVAISTFVLKEFWSLKIILLSTTSVIKLLIILFNLIKINLFNGKLKRRIKIVYFTMRTKTILQVLHFILNLCITLKVCINVDKSNYKILTCMVSCKVSKPIQYLIQTSLSKYK